MREIAWRKRGDILNNKKKIENHKNGVFLADGWLLRRIMLHMEHKFSPLPNNLILKIVTEIKFAVLVVARI